MTYIKRGGNGTAIGISADGMKNTLVQSLVQIVHRVVERQDHLDLAQLKMITLQLISRVFCNSVIRERVDNPFGAYILLLIIIINIMIIN